MTNNSENFTCNKTETLEDFAHVKSLMSELQNIEDQMEKLGKRKKELMASLFDSVNDTRKTVTGKRHS